MGSPPSGDADRRIAAGEEEVEVLRGSFRAGREEVSGGGGGEGVFLLLDHDLKSERGVSAC